jgi:hypothetical protein
MGRFGLLHQEFQDVPQGTPTLLQAPHRGATPVPAPCRGAIERARQNQPEQKNFLLSSVENPKTYGKYLYKNPSPICIRC